MSQYIVLPPSLLQPEATKQWLTSFAGATGRQLARRDRYLTVIQGINLVKIVYESTADDATRKAADTIMGHKFKLYLWQDIYLVPANSARTTGGHAALSAAAGDVHHVKPD